MNTHSEVQYNQRTVKEWVRRAMDGEMALTDFQRSYVWTNDKAAKYIKAIIDDKPVGLYLILAKGDPPQFSPRNFNKIDTQFENVTELILDGQQRMTSLLQMLTGNADKRFFVEVSDLSSKQLEVCKVDFIDRNTTRGREYESPANAFNSNLIPLDILLDERDEEGLTRLARWCSEVAETVEPQKTRVLEGRIENFISERFFDRKIWFCLLPETTNRSTATEIFVETNTSSVRIKRFDIEVACARGKYDEDLRDSIRDAYDQPANNDFRHYFREDPEDWIPEIGEWMLKIACLRAGKPPREINYGGALDYLLKNQVGDSFPNMEEIFGDLSWALDHAAKLGAITRRTLPSWPPLHVLATLHPDYERIKDPTKINTARTLIHGYYWRCLFSNRYEAQANDRLFEDYVALKSSLKQIEEQGVWTAKPPAFEDEVHPIYTKDELLRSGWIGQSRLGRALASVAMSKKPDDWITGEQLDRQTIRKLEQGGNLDRHHVFSRHALRNANVPNKEIQNGLNGVLLDKKTNRKMSKEPPEKYLKMIIDQAKISENELRRRVEGHFVPYDSLKDVGDISKQYENFLKERAKILYQYIKTRAELPKC